MHRIDWLACLAYPIAWIAAHFLTPLLGIDRVAHRTGYELAWGGVLMVFYIGLYYIIQWLNPRKPLG